MGQNIESVITNRELTEATVKGIAGSTDLSPDDRFRFQGVLVMSFRRLEAVFVQHELGSIDSELADGFERSLLPLLATPVGIDWWKTARETFHRSFVDHVEQLMTDGKIASQMPSMPKAKDESLRG